MKKAILFCSIAILALTLISCDKTTITTSTTTTNGDTSVKITVLSSGVPQAGYSVLMLTSEASQSEPLPVFIRAVVSDENGEAFFDLNSNILSSIPRKYYFIATQKQSDGYVWKAPYMQYQVELSKGTSAQSTILVQP